jgi:hypothetical protein
MFKSEKTMDAGLTTVGERCGTISVGGTSKYDEAAGIDVCIGGVGIEMSLLRQLRLVNKSTT